MKKNGHNIITSDDVTMLGKNSGKDLQTVLETALNDIDSLKSNVKWLYKYGGVGGSGGSGSSTSDKWSATVSLGTVLIPEFKDGEEEKTIIFQNTGDKRLYIHINNPGGDTFIVDINNEGQISRLTRLNQDVRWTYDSTINLQENSRIQIIISDGNELSKTYEARYIVNAYSMSAYLTNNEGQKYESYFENGVERYNLFIDDINLYGLKYVLKYNSSIDSIVTYFYTKFNSNEEVNGTTEFHDGDYQLSLIEVDAIDGIGNLSNDIASAYTFLSKVVIEGVGITYNIGIDLLPNDLYLKVVPDDLNTILYKDTSTENPEYLIIGNRSFNLTPYNGKTGGASNITCTYKINDLDVIDNFGNIATDNIRSGKSFLRTFMFSTEGWNKIEFKARIGDVFKIFTYYFYTKYPENTINWWGSVEPFSSAYYRYGEGSIDDVNLWLNESKINPSRYLVKNTNDLNADTIISKSNIGTLEMLINIGIQYNYINDESKEIIRIPTVDVSDTNYISVYQDKILIGPSTELLGIFFIEEEQDYDTYDNTKYHLITIARKFIRLIGIQGGEYELSVYIDGVLLANSIKHIAISLYNLFILYNGNYSINLLDISYFVNGSLDETEIVRYWYAYLNRIQNVLEEATYKSNLLDIFKNFTLEKSNNLFNGHVFINTNTLSNLIQTIKRPVMCLEYNPNVNKDSEGNTIGFFDWSDYSYQSDSHNARQLIVGIKWSNGSGTSETKLDAIDTSAVSTPDGNSKRANFKLDILGSTTRTYKSKNYLLSIEFEGSDDSFVPLYTPWFSELDTNTFLPENSFTLKADIVDSSHTNNTCMGKFINENSDKFQDAKLLTSEYSGHIKNCLEGFPFLLFVHTTGEDNYYYLGIYNFNLGRTSNFNLGYNDLRALPHLNSSTPDIYNFNIYSVYKVSTPTQYGSDIKNGLITAEIDDNKPWFDFSQYDESILFLLPNRPNDEGYMFSEIISGLDTSSTLSQDTKQAISRFVLRVSRGGGYIFDKIEKGFHDDIYNKYTTQIGYVPSSSILYVRSKPGTLSESEEIFTVKESGIQFYESDLLNLISTHIEGDLEGVPSYCNYKSVVEYYTYCMAFGLLDSVQKNLNIKSWNRGNTFYLAFYDMDTCLGINNNGKSVSYYAFSDYWQNPSELIVDTTKDGTKIVNISSVNIYRDYAPSTGDINLYDIPSSYIFAVAKYAKSIILAYQLLGPESTLSLDTIVTPQNLWAQLRGQNGSLRNSEYFIDTYYNGYMSGIDELMFNYDYRAKYFRELDSETFDEEASRFRGRSIGYVKDWLYKRFHILDAYFNLVGNKEIYISDGARYESVNRDLTGSNYKTVYETYPINTLGYSSDVYINKSIFGDTVSFIGDIDLTVLAPDYTPLIITSSSNIYRYLLEDSSKMYNIKINNQAGKLVFGGSSMWTYLNSINSIANGSISITSDKLTILNGDKGTTSGWALNMPALQEVHLNGINYAGALEFSRDSNFYNLTTVDIRNSKINLTIDSKNVRIIDLSNINSGSINILNCTQLESIIFNNSSILSCTINKVPVSNDGKFTLDRNNITNLELVGNGEDLIIQNDSGLETLIVENFKTITISNCPELKTILSSSGILESIKTSNCQNILNVELNVANCSIIELPKTRLESLILNNTTIDYSKITKLDISESKISKITYNLILDGIKIEQYHEEDGTLNLIPMSKLDNLNVKNDSNIIYIKFNNDESNPIHIRNSFEGCTNLERIYGHVEIYASSNVSTFNGLTKFSIFGTLEDKWKEFDKTKDSIIQTPIQIILENISDVNEYDDIVKSHFFWEGNYATNISFKFTGTTTFYRFVYNTNLTLFDIYYLFNMIGFSNSTYNISLGYLSFYTKNALFAYSTGNLFNRYTFYKCNKIVSISSGNGLVFHTGITLLYSPEFNSEGEVINDNGLFSPLTKLTTLSLMCSEKSYFSRFLFRRSSGNYENFKTFSHISVKNIYDDIDLYNTLSEVPDFETNKNNYIDKIGNLTDFFKNIPKINNLVSVFNMDIINYDTLEFPDSITSINNSFINLEGFGEFNWKNTFNKEEYNKLTSIAYSFVLSGIYYENRVQFIISEDMFDNMSNLIYLGSANSTTPDSFTGITTFAKTTLTTDPTFGLHGGGFSKTLANGIFPYNIVKNLINLNCFVGLFSELYLYDPVPIEYILFPSTLFLNNSNLTNIACLFKNCNVPIKLTSEGFINNPKLTNITLLFYTSPSRHGNINTNIPHKFFYLGNSESNKTFYGTDDIEVMNKDILYRENPSLEGAELFIPDEGISITYKNPIKNILYGTECFYGQDRMKPYIWENFGDWNNYKDDYINTSYIPYKYYIDNNGNWRERIESESLYYDISSIYDGDPEKLISGVFCKDDDTDIDNKANLNKSRTVLYFCPPDLLNSFLNNANLSIKGMFKWCGSGAFNDYGNRNTATGGSGHIGSDSYGRICPYLFDTISNVTHLIEFFENCKGINSYSDKYGVTYLIPPTLFSNVNSITSIAKMFAGIYFDESLNTQFISNINSTSLDVRGLFSMCRYSSTGSFNSIFQSKTLSAISGIFANFNVTLQGISNTNPSGVSISGTTTNQPMGTNINIDFNNIISSAANVKSLAKLRSNIYYLFIKQSGQITESNSGISEILLYNNNIS